MVVGERQKILCFVEDPGAANYVGPIVSALRDQGHDVDLVARGTGLRQLQTLKVAVSETLYRQASELLDNVQPNLLLVGTSENPETLGLQLIDAARSRQLSCVGAVDNMANAEFRFRGHAAAALNHAPDWLLLPDRWTRDQFVDLGFDPGRALVCGHPYYDKVRYRGVELRKIGRAALRAERYPEAGTRPIIAFLSEISDGLNPEQFHRSADYHLIGRGESTARTAIVLEEFLDAMKRHGSEFEPYMLLRPHPKNKRGELAPYADCFDAIEWRGDPLTTVYVADLVVGMSSSLLAEAAVLGRPTLSIVPRHLERDWLPTTAAGLTPCVSDRSTLGSTLGRMLDELGGGEFGTAGMDQVNEIRERAIARLIPDNAIHRSLKALTKIQNTVLPVKP